MAGSNLVQALERGLKILEIASESADGVTISQMMDVLGVKQSTAYNLARTLLVNGYLVRRSGPIRYALGPAAVSLGHRKACLSWRKRLETVVRELAAVIPSATVIVAELRAGDLMMSLRLHPSHPGHLERDPSMFFSPYTSACSLCFQAFAPRPEVIEFRSRYPLGETNSGKWTGLDALDAFLSQARKDGFLVVSDDRLNRVACPVWSDDGRLVAVIGGSQACVKRGSRFGEEQLVKHIYAAAKRLSNTPCPQHEKQGNICVR